VYQYVCIYSIYLGVRINIIISFAKTKGCNPNLIHIKDRVTYSVFSRVFTPF